MLYAQLYIILHTYLYWHCQYKYVCNINIMYVILPIWQEQGQDDKLFTYSEMCFLVKCHNMSFNNYK